MDVNCEHTVDNIIRRNLSGQTLRDFNKLYYGREEHCEIKLQNRTLSSIKKERFDVSAYTFHASKEDTRSPRIVTIGLIQHSIVLPTSDSVTEQRKAIFDKVHKLIKVAASEGVQVICLQEAWSMPFFLCTDQKTRWLEFVESAEHGPSTRFLSKLAHRYKMVIVSPILEIDCEDIWWNTAVVINENGNILGKHRKNHLPSVGSFSETSFYTPGNTGHPVFDTKHGKIGVNICYGRHQALNWLMFGLNGAEIVFNPAATISEFGESFWGIEARNAAIANNYFTCSINRVGTEEFVVKNNDNNLIRTCVREYYGSSYMTGPDGCRTPSLSRQKDGLLIGNVDLNLCSQTKDNWGFNMTRRLDLYAKELNQIVNGT